MDQVLSKAQWMHLVIYRDRVVLHLWCTSQSSGGLPVALVVKNLPASAGDVKDVGSIPVSGRSPGEGNGNLLQYSCLKNPTDRGAWRATVHGVTQNQTQLK